MNTFISQNLISLISLSVAIIAFITTIWLNHIAIHPTFRWIKSENDDSVKLIISITNLSPRTTLITNVVLRSGKSVISDNGYDFDQAETAKNKREAKERRQNHLNRLKELESRHQNHRKSSKIQVPDLLNLTEDNDIWAENTRYQEEQMSHFLAPKKLMQIHNEHSSDNFDVPTALFGNSTVSFSYWLSPSEIPDKVSITFSRALPLMHKTKSFQPPRVPNKQDQRNDIKKQGNDL
ncbi:hypothetical protein [Levilactobacillus tujiorum]|uniref:hypothetical protein n=1 Tax=Levilactobacillus tujiorum TaxID=2912243 RepID=UPI0014578D8E|nr:hypothetical protein [Levilactobacillus tujiorum]NLR32242.1 hypothetical protein [Levilactobacillus tujiorum]